jgi:uncharacterized membrane protein YdjX (TVP38/TMEM64 family)
VPIQVNQNQPSRPVAGARRLTPGRWVPVAIIAAIMLFIAWTGWHRQLSLETLMRHRAAIDAFVTTHRAGAIVGFIAVYATAVALSFPGAMMMTICGGVVFGGLVGGLAAIAAATLGAVGIFLIAKTAVGGAVREALERRAGPVAARLAAGFREDAFCYLLFLRLLPIFPYWLVNLVSAMCGVRLAPFIAATAIGIIPASFAYAVFGAGLDSVITAEETTYRACLAIQQTGCRLGFDIKAAATPQLIAGLVALGLVALVPLAIKRLRAGRIGRAP